MTGSSRLFRPKFGTLAAISAVALSIALPAQAGERTAAPIKYAGQGSYTPTARTSMPTTANTNRQRSAPIRYGDQGSSSQRYGAPTYAQPISRAPQQSASVQPSAKRIEFRYPDQPNVVHGSDGSQRAEAAAPPIKFASRKAAVSPQRVRQYASVGTPTPIVKPQANPPVLHQPEYAQPVVEEVAMTDVVVPQVSPAAGNTISGAVYEPVAQPGFEKRGLASWYGDEYHGQPTANGEIFDMTALTAAHPTLPLPSLAQVTNMQNGREIVVRVNDRGPFVPTHMIDLSKRAADELGFLVDGEAEVQVRYLGPAPVAGQVAAGQGSVATQRQPQPVIAAPTPVQAAIETLPQPKMDPIPNPVGPTFFIQAGSFSDIANAERFSHDLGGALPVDVVMANVNGADFFRVVIGPYDSRSEAAAMRDQLSANNIVDGVLITGR